MTRSIFDTNDIPYYHSSYVLWETAMIVIREQLKQENQRKLFKKLLLMTIRPEFNYGGEAASIVLFKFLCVSVVPVVSLVSFRWFQWFRFGVLGFSICLNFAPPLLLWSLGLLNRFAGQFFPKL